MERTIEELGKDLLDAIVFRYESARAMDHHAPMSVEWKALQHRWRFWEGKEATLRKEYITQRTDRDPQSEDDLWRAARFLQPEPQYHTKPAPIGWIWFGVSQHGHLNAGWCRKGDDATRYAKAWARDPKN